MLVFILGCAFVTEEDFSKRIDPDDDGVSLTEDCYNYDGTVGELQMWYIDGDGDGYGLEAEQALFCKPPNDSWVQIIGDCNDTDAGVFPQAEEIAGDGLDQDCDQQELCFVDADDDGYPSQSTAISGLMDCSSAGLSLLGLIDCDDEDADTYPGAAAFESSDACMHDGDGDGYGDASVVGGDVLPGLDCDDNNQSIHPQALEVCDLGIDNNCSGVADDDDALLDETTASLWYIDGDGDGFGDINNSAYFCEAPTGFVDNYYDCNDVDTAIHPQAVEIAIDGIDQDCDGLELCYQDLDLDGFGALSILSADFGCAAFGLSSVNTDCEDTRSDVFPNAEEVIGDGVDQDCDGFELCYEDLDSDGYRTDTIVESTNTDCSGTAESLIGTQPIDCDDTSNTTHPGAAELDSTAVCMKDQDQDGYGAIVPAGTIFSGTDCNDGEASIHPAATEIAGDGVDQNCDYQELCYEDLDQDGYRSNNTNLSNNSSCTDPSESLAGSNALDCDDTSGATYPGVAIAEANASACMLDEDGDGFGDNNPSTLGVTSGTDCDDSSSNINPNATEIPIDGIDQDCDATELCYDDADGDGYAGSTLVEVADFGCSSPYALESDDCDDNDANVFPFAAELDASTDYNCDGFESTDDTCFSSEDANGTYFLYCTDPVDWETARDRCDDHGYVLTSIRSQDENDHIQDQLLGRSWIGFSDQEANGNGGFCSDRRFEWLDNFPGFYQIDFGNWFNCQYVVSTDSDGYLNWDSGEPNNYGQNEDCVVIKNTSGKWNDVDCTENRYYVCSFR